MAALIDPTTVTFTSLTDPATRVLEQNFQFDLVSTDKLLLKYIDRPITVERNSAGGSTVEQRHRHAALVGQTAWCCAATTARITALHDYSALRFPRAAGRPDHAAHAGVGHQSPRTAGEQRARVTYQTGGITWWADYNLIFNEGKDANSGFVDLSAWVSIINQSGATLSRTRSSS